MEKTDILTEADLARLKVYLGRDVYERLYNTPTNSSKMQRSSLPLKPHTNSEVLVLPTPVTEMSAISSDNPGKSPSSQEQPNTTPKNTPTNSDTNRSDVFERLYNTPKVCSKHRPAEEDLPIKSFSDPPRLSQDTQSPRENLDQSMRQVASADTKVALDSPDAVSDVTGIIASLTAANTNGTPNPHSVKRQLFGCEKRPRSRRNPRESARRYMRHTFTSSISGKFNSPLQPSSDQVLRKVLTISTESKDTRHIVRFTNTVDLYFENQGDSGFTLEAMNEVIGDLYPSLDKKALSLLAYKSLQTTGDGLVDFEEFKQFVHFLAYFSELWKDAIQFDEINGLTITKDDFLAVAGRMKLFHNAQAAFSELDKADRGFIMFDRFCTFCAWHKLRMTFQSRLMEKKLQEELALAQDKASKQKDSSAVADQQVDLQPLESVLAMFDSEFVPSWEATCEIFHQMDVGRQGRIALADIERGFLELYAQRNSRPLALETYKTSASYKADSLDVGAFFEFVLFLVYFNNLWEYFSLSKRKDRRISRRRFLVATNALGLFTDPEQTYANLTEGAEDDFLTYDNFCSVCARRQLELLRL